MPIPLPDIANDSKDSVPTPQDDQGRRPGKAQPKVIETPGGQKPPSGVPRNYKPMWVHPDLASDLHKFYGPKGHIIPHHSALKWNG